MATRGKRTGKRARGHGDKQEGKGTGKRARRQGDRQEGKMARRTTIIVTARHYR